MFPADGKRPLVTPRPLRLVLLTPLGRGAVATLRVEGPGAVAVVAEHFVTRNSLSVDRLVFGRFGAEPAEEVVVRRESDAAVEIHCHGGLAAVRRLQQILVESGCRLVSWQDWAARHEPDPIAAAARIALAEATTPRTAAILLDQYRGSLARALQEIDASLESGDSIAARQQIDALLARGPLGLHLVRPWQVVVAGRPNVGKSSLINAIVGFGRVIVHPTPGTTRDIVAVQTVLDGWPVELSDTAGLHDTGDAIERAGIELAKRKLAAADLILLVFDRTAAWSPSDRALLESQPGALAVHNKIDLAPEAGTRPPGHAVSALREEGIEELCRAIVGRLIPRPPSPGAAVPFTPEQLQQIHGYLRRV